MNISGINTPALILDVNALRANSEAMKRLLSGSRIKLRPHYKSHKCAALAKWQMENGAIGMTCAKLSEAEDLCDCGVEDILIANQIVDPAKIRRLADLAKHCRLTVCVDGEETVSRLSAAAVASGSTVHCLVEYEIGMERCGVASHRAVLGLAKQILSCDNLSFDGLQVYAGHLSHLEDEALRKRLTRENVQRIKALIAFLKENGVEVKTVSGGSTGTAELKAASDLYTELQAGSYLFMDATYRLLNLPFQNALFLLTTVVSQREGLTVVDAGVKTCGVDQGMPLPFAGKVERIVASEEHFQLHGYTETALVGDRIRLIPAHCCTTVNLHDKIYLVDGDKVMDRIIITSKGIGR